MSSVPLTLNLIEGSVSVSFSPQAARELKAAIDELMKVSKPSLVKLQVRVKSAPSLP